MPAATRTNLTDIKIKVSGADIERDVYSDLLSVSIESRLDMPAQAILEVADQSLALVDGATFDIGKPLKIELQSADSGSYAAVFEGEITAIEPCMAADGTTTLRVEGTTKAHRLYAGTKSRSWENKKDSDIFRAIASEDGLGSDIDATTEVYAHVTQAAQTNWDFVRERAERIGYLAFVNGNQLHVRRPDYNEGAVELKYGEDLLEFRPRATAAAQPAEVDVDYWDMSSKGVGGGNASTSAIGPETGRTAKTIAEKYSRSPMHLARFPAFSQNDATQIAQGAKNALWTGVIQAEGRCAGNPSMVAGAKATISGVGTKFGGSYVLSQVRHLRDKDGYYTEFEVRGLRSDSMSDLIVGGVAGASPGQQSRWTGVVPGIVSDNNDPENLGRLKISMPWLASDYVSTWARVAVPMAGSAKGGVFFAPEINDEVLVAFEHGDINVPYVIGFLYNGRDAIPDGTVVSGKVEKRVLITTKGHTVSLIDKQGSEAIEIKDHTQNNFVTIDSTSGLITVQGTDIQLKASNSIKLDAVNIEVTASGNFKVNASANVDIVATAQMNVQASGPVAVKGAVINLN